jgi:four helix bundle protein
LAAIQRFQDIRAWQQARILVKEIYRTCAETRLGKDFGLRDQACRAAVSAMSNIAEGFGRTTHKDFAHFLDVARGSSFEVQSLLYVGLDVGYLPEKQFEALFAHATSVISMIAAFTSYLRK